jgi:Lar family restriction alleviation protein
MCEKGTREMAELKPCPFCGGEAHLDREEIFCDICGAKMPIELYVYGSVACDRFPTYQEARAEMIESWNRRV